MKLGLTDVDWAHIGAVLARTGDEEQAVFFKAFVKECNSWGTRYQVEFQFASINLKLTKDERDVLGMLGFEEPTP